MQPDLSRVTVYVRPGRTDMRKQINGLTIIATEQMGLDPLSGSLFLFCCHRSRFPRLKLGRFLRLEQQ